MMLFNLATSTSLSNGAIWEVYPYPNGQMRDCAPLKLKRAAMPRKPVKLPSLSSKQSLVMSPLVSQ